MSGAVALLVCFFPPSLFETIDYIAFYRPNFHFFREAVLDGRLPLWNPYIGLGRPFLADLQSAVFYLPGYLLFAGKAGVFLLIWGHLWLAAAGMKAFSQQLHIGKPESYFLSLCFLGSGILMGRWFSGQLLYACGLCYVPFLFANAAQLGRRWNLRLLALQALLMALQLLSGHPQVFWFSTLGLGAFVLARNLWPPWREGMGDAFGALFQLSLAGFWALCLSAIALLPFFELVQQGNRAAASAEFSNFVRMDWQFFQSLCQTRIGNMAVPWEINVFVGIFVVLLGVAGLCQVRDRNARGLLGVVICSLLISIGDHSPLFNVFLKWLPGYGSLRIHSRAAMLIGLGLICGTGIWLSRPHAKLRTLWTANFNLEPRRLFPVLVILQSVLLLYAAWLSKRAYHPADYNLHSPDSPLQEMIAKELRKEGLVQPFQPPPRVSVPGKRSTSNNAMIRHYGNFDAYTSLFLKRPWAYLHAMLGLEPPKLNNTFLLPEVYESALPYTNMNLVAGIAFHSSKLLLATNPSPRAFVVYAARVVPDYNSAIEALVKGHDIYSSALIEQSPTASLPETSTFQTGPVQFRHFDPHTIMMDVSAARDGLLIVAEAWYPGWQATVDDQAAPVLPVNAWMRAVPVSAGNHRVKMSFHQNHLFPGTAISFAAAAMLLCAFRPRRRELVK